MAASVNKNFRENQRQIKEHLKNRFDRHRQTYEVVVKEKMAKIETQKKEEEIKQTKAMGNRVKKDRKLEKTQRRTFRRSKIRGRFFNVWGLYLIERNASALHERYIQEEVQGPAEKVSLKS